MADIQEVISAWECCTDEVEDNCDSCPYNNGFNGCMYFLKIDTIELLKKQLPVKASTRNTYWANCDGCGKVFRKFGMPAEKAKHCPSCGRKIEWGD